MVFASPLVKLVMFALLTGIRLPSVVWAQLRDEEFIRQHAPPYVAQALKDLKACEFDLHREKGERAATLARASRICYVLGELAEDRQRLAYYEQGKQYAEMLVEEEPSRMEGYYWLAENLSGVAEVGGAGRALRILPEIVGLLEKAVSMDPSYDQAGPHRVLGSI